MLNSSFYLNEFEGNFNKLKDKYGTQPCDCDATTVSYSALSKINASCIILSKYLQDLSYYMKFAPKFKISSSSGLDELKMIEKKFKAFSKKSVRIIEIFTQMNNLIADSSDDLIINIIDLIYLISTVIHFEYMNLESKSIHENIKNYGFDSQSTRFVSKESKNYFILNECIDQMTSKPLLKLIANAASHYSCVPNLDITKSIDTNISANFIAFCIILDNKNQIFHKIFKNSYKGCVNFLSVCGTITACELDTFCQITSNVLKLVSPIKLSKKNGLLLSNDVDKLQLMCEHFSQRYFLNFPLMNFAIHKIIETFGFISIIFLRRMYEYYLVDNPEEKSASMGSMIYIFPSYIHSYVKIGAVYKLAISRQVEHIFSKFKDLIDLEKKSKKPTKALDQFIAHFSEVMHCPHLFNASKARLDWMSVSIQNLLTKGMSTKINEILYSILKIMLMTMNLKNLELTFRNLIILSVMSANESPSTLIKAIIDDYLGKNHKYTDIKPIVSFFKVHEIYEKIALNKYQRDGLFSIAKSNAEQICSNFGEFVYYQSKFVTSNEEYELLNKQSSTINPPLFNNIEFNASDFSIDLSDSQLLLSPLVESYICQCFINEIRLLFEYCETQPIATLQLLQHFIGMIRRSHERIRKKFNKLVEFDYLWKMIDKSKFVNNLGNELLEVMKTWDFDFDNTTFYPPKSTKGCTETVDFSDFKLWGPPLINNALNESIKMKYFPNSLKKLAFYHFCNLKSSIETHNFAHICSKINNTGINALKSVIVEFFDKLYDEDKLHQYLPYKIDQNVDGYRDYISQAIDSARIAEDVFSKATSLLKLIGNSMSLLHLIDLSVNLDKRSNLFDNNSLIKGISFTEFCNFTQGILDMQSNPVFRSFENFTDSDRKSFYQTITTCVDQFKLTEEEKSITNLYSTISKEHFDQTSAFLRGFIHDSINTICEGGFENKNVDTGEKYTELLRIDGVMENYYNVALNMLITELTFGNKENLKHHLWSLVLGAVTFLFASEQYKLFSLSSTVYSLAKFGHFKNPKQFNGSEIVNMIEIAHSFLKECWRDDCTWMKGAIECQMPDIDKLSHDKFYLLRN